MFGVNLQTRLPESRSVLVQLIYLISGKNNETFTYPWQTKLPLEDLKCDLVISISNNFKSLYNFKHKMESITGQSL